MIIVENACAKINLYLDVTQKRNDGYHDILSVMQTVSLCDKIELTETDSSEIVVKSSSAELPSDAKQNLVYRAADLFFKKIGKRAGGLLIEIEKNIPVAAGLAGGSSDAAATLRALNKLYNHPFSLDELCAIGKEIGADVPFCIVGGAKITRGIGDLLTDVKGLPECYIVIAKGEEGVSTPAAYRALDLKFDNFNGYDSGKGFCELIDALEHADINKLSKHVYNVFEEVSKENDSIEVIKNVLNVNGALGSMMSGSGPSVFGIFLERENADKAANSLSEMGICANVCNPVNSLEP